MEEAALISTRIFRGRYQCERALVFRLSRMTMNLSAQPLDNLHKLAMRCLHFLLIVLAALFLRVFLIRLHCPMDTLTKDERSKRMSLVRSYGNKSTELSVIRLFRAAGITGWRRNYSLIGKPDFVFPKQRLALFIDGCFWHGCTLHRRIPKTNQEYWKNKIERNTCRDKLITNELQKKGWAVIRIWEHELKGQDPIGKVKRKLATQQLCLQDGR